MCVPLHRYDVIAGKLLAKCSVLLSLAPSCAAEDDAGEARFLAGVEDVVSGTEGAEARLPVAAAAQDGAGAAFDEGIAKWSTRRVTRGVWRGGG